MALKTGNTVHSSMTYGCRLVKQSKFMQKCINYLLMSLDSIRTLRIQTSHSPAPPWLKGGDVWHFRLTVKFCSLFLISEFFFLSVSLSSNTFTSPPSLPAKNKQNKDTDERTTSWPLLIIWRDLWNKCLNDPDQILNFPFDLQTDARCRLYGNII